MSQAHTELIEPLLKELQRRNATDVQITVGSPPMLRIDGHLTPSEMSQPLTGEDTELRVRRKGDDTVLTVKRGHGLDRGEQEVAIGAEAFEALWPLTEGKRISKAVSFDRNCRAKFIGLSPTMVMLRCSRMNEYIRIAMWFGSRWQPCENPAAL